MKAIIVLFDSLNRKFLPGYGDNSVHAPNFKRLEQRSVTFDKCYVGSIPCMPARRELHTGRYNFLHRNWGPLEPFDDSMPELLGKAGVYTHLVTDHAHYWEDGGATYHTRYSSWEGVRGQQGDFWKGEVADPDIPPVVKIPMTPDGKKPARVWRSDWVNRKQFITEEDYPQNRTFKLGLEFLEENKDTDNWMLQIETFDPHEPFIAPERFQNLYNDTYEGDHYDWPRGICDENEETIDHIRNLYRARVSMCDENLGKVLDTMDEHDMWKDTMLIVCSDHGFLLGEHSFWGKNGTPMYEEISHTPLFIWDPRCGKSNERRESLVQTIDFAPTLLDFFDMPVPCDMQGKPLRSTIGSDQPVRETALFGFYGEQVNITDGRWVYMRAPTDSGNSPLYMYTLMPTNMFSRFHHTVLAQATLTRPGWHFLKNSPVLKVEGVSRNQIEHLTTELFDLDKSPDQMEPVVNPEKEKEMETLLIRKMIDTDAPIEQYQRLGLNPAGF